jgi:putative PIG3 family NAD(P)H quinone oxidoreductase
MIAIQISEFGGPQVLQATERPQPKPGEDELVIRIKAAGVSRADIMQREGKYPPPPGTSDIPGLDAAGVVDSAGSGIKRFSPGDRVCAILAGGGYAEYCVVSESQVLPIPEGWSEMEAATLPENLFTVYDNLITRAKLKGGETVLIHGGASGIGSMAIMVARAWNAVPFATAGSEQKCAACLETGAQSAINYRHRDFVAEVKRLTAERGVNVVLDIVGGSYLKRNLEALALEGRLAIVATQGGRAAELDILQLMLKRARIIGSTMRVRTPEQKGAVARALLKDVWPLLPAKRTIRPMIDSTFPLKDAWRAHERLESGEHTGKIVLLV